ncbi:MAG TPA: DUF222 domain-containing protein [Acidimicrobiia bacterium]|nr:DUF222 domain-containing protein [Acidimicrobiia bacterium]
MFDTVTEYAPRTVLPDGLAEMTPGPGLAAVLAGLDRKVLNGHEMVIVLRATARQVAHYQAQMYSDMMEVALSPAGDAASRPERINNLDEDSAAEIGAALRLTRRAADIQLGVAWDLVERLPEVWQALSAGEIDLPRARVICLHTGHLTEERAQEAAGVALPQAPGLTTGQLAARLRRLTMSIDPEDAAKRVHQGLEERRVIGEANPDGTANLLALNLPPEAVAAMLERVKRLAKGAKTSEDTRNLDQICADVLSDLVTGRGLSPDPAGVVDITVDLTTLTGLSEVPGEIPGWGPVIADIARQVALAEERGQWRVTVTHPRTGQVVWNGVTRRRPTITERRYIQAREPVCVFPGCRMPARDSDLDHTQDSAKGGPTQPANLGHLCRHHHRLKHEAGWKLEQPTPGNFTWTSPLGHTYQSKPRAP